MNGAVRQKLRVDVSDGRRGSIEVAALRARIIHLSAELHSALRRRELAEGNAKRFHALLLEERIKHLPTQTNGPAATPFRERGRASQEKHTP